MDRRYRRIGVTVVLLLVMLLMTACRDNSIEDELDVKPTNGVSVPGIVSSTGGDDIKVPQLISIQYYTVNIDTYELETAAAMVVEGKIVTPEMIMEFFADSMEDRGIIFSINDIKIKDDIITVNLTDSICDIAEDSKELEKSILDAIAQSLLDNISDCKSISFSIKNKSYQTNNYSFELGDIYMGD